MKNDLAERVDRFRTLRLPGQPMASHMGTFNLVNDLWEAVQELQLEVERLKDELRYGPSE
jgi:hypothetical protein